ncbi:hypothetical protein ACQFYA_18330 [Promicromonospora sp. Marseille-Q5078]
MGSRHVTDAYPERGTADDHGPSPLRAAAVIGVVLIQAGVAGLVLSTWWRHARGLLEDPALGSVLWHVLTAALFVWVVVAEIRALVRARRSPLTVVSVATVAMVVAVLLEALGPR